MKCKGHVVSVFILAVLFLILSSFNLADAASSCKDKDGDGYAICAGDCHHNDSSVNPGVMEGPLGDLTCADGKDNEWTGHLITVIEK